MYIKELHAWLNQASAGSVLWRPAHVRLPYNHFNVFYSNKYGSDFGIPSYMQAKKAFSSILNVQRQNSFNLTKGLPVYYRPPAAVDKWQVRKVDPNEWRSSSIDSAYG